MQIHYKNTTIFYTIQGKGSTIVFLHGFLENSSMWKFLIPNLENKHTIITIDLLGHGKSDCLGYIHTMEMMAEIVYAVLTHENIKTASLVGHSMGGYVALAFAERHPEMCSEIILLNSTPKQDTAERKENRNRAIALVKKNKNGFLSMAISNLFAEENKTRFTKEIQGLKKEALQMKTQGIIAALEGMKIRKDRTQFLKKLSTPKTIIAGSLDPIMPLESLKIVAKSCHCQLTIWEGGHMSTIENRSEMLKYMHFIE